MTRAHVLSQGATLTDADVIDSVEALLSTEPTIGAVRKRVAFMPKRVKDALRPLLEARGYGEALS